MDVEGVAEQQASNAFREDFDAFYSRERQNLLGLAYVLSGSRSGTDDLAQEAFLAAYRHWDQVSGYDNPGAWVRRVLANRVTSRFRRRKAEAKAILRLGQPDYTVPSIDADAVSLWAEVRRLPTRQAQAIALYYLDGQTVADIAVILECSENTVHTHLRRGRETLARRLPDQEES